MIAAGRACLLSLAVCACLTPFAATAAPSTSGALALSLRGFSDGIHHWRNANRRTDYPRLEADDVRGIADNLLLHQRANGGWRENEDPLRILSAEEQAQLLADKNLTDTSLDNDTGWPQITFLAAAYELLGDERHRDGCLRGIGFLLAAQHPSGGWPHSFPVESGYRRHVTIADSVFPHTLRTLRWIARGEQPFGWVDAALRARVAAAVARGEACLLRLQVVQNGELTIWAGQYHFETLEPTGARAFELPGLVARESISVVRYLMELEAPSPEVIRAVEAAAAWYERHAIYGWRVETFEAPAEDYTWHTSTFDRRMVPDPEAPRLWARFYDLGTSEPFLANRDGRRVATLAEVARERRTGYEWYGVWAEKLLTRDIPAWRARHGLPTPPPIRSDRPDAR